MNKYTYVVHYWKRIIKILRYFPLSPRSTNTTYITRENIKDNFQKFPINWTPLTKNVRQYKNSK